MGDTAKSWQDVAAKKREQRADKIPAQWRIPAELMPPASANDVQDFPRTSGLFTKQELLLTELTASEVVQKIACGDVTSLEVVNAICKRAAVAQQLINCVTEIYFDEAFTRAQELDDYFARERKTVGPLHGLPISLKDQFNLKGVDTTIGYVSYANKPASQNSTLSNVPATLMMGESVNNVFGRTVNPRNREVTTGGSSGGESALVTFRASYMGVGTDIGGSIRHPCSYTGLFGLRPTVRSCAGLMCRSVDDIELFMSSLLQQQPWLHDPQTLPIPWRRDQMQLPEKLCFGFAMGDGTVTPTPPLRKTMEIAKAKLLAAGHSVVDYILYEAAEAVEIITKMWSADAGNEFQRDTDAAGEALHPHLEAWLGRSANMKAQTVKEMWENQHRRAVLAQTFLSRWESTKEMTGTGRAIDGLIMPSTPFPVIRHDGGYPWHYGALSPLLDLITGVFPITKVDLELDSVLEDWEPTTEKDKEVMEYYGKPENHENALVGLAVIGRRLEEEKVTAMLRVVNEIVGVDY
ncbi:amidase [Lophiotrema nucula]|uniref:Amidase n=1 Tax=Lophiotrema nucula TaxID=690887 RepID=A0A6A5ZDY7_9PLEO|nr:amidase [Lophiotrema nucula]